MTKLKICLLCISLVILSYISYKYFESYNNNIQDLCESKWSSFPGKINNLALPLKITSFTSTQLTSSIESNKIYKTSAEIRGILSKELAGNAPIKFTYTHWFSEGEVPDKKNTIFFKYDEESMHYDWDFEVIDEHSMLHLKLILDSINFEEIDGMKNVFFEGLFKNDAEGIVTYALLNSLKSGRDQKKLYITGMISADNSSSILKGWIDLDSENYIISGIIQSDIISKIQITVNNVESDNIIISCTKTVIEPFK